MTDPQLAGAIGAAAIIGALLTWLIIRPRLVSQTEQNARLEKDIEKLAQELEEVRREVEEKAEELARANLELTRYRIDLVHEKRAANEKLAVLDEAKTVLLDSFKALSADALKSNNQAFLDLARANLEKLRSQANNDLEIRRKAVEGLVSPIQTSLAEVTRQIRELETARAEAYGSLTEQVKSLALSQERLQSETGNLVKALRKPQVRGRWGEIQLKRVVEMAGMVPHCDFVEQESIAGEEGILRPDMVVKLPGGKNVVVDAKAPLEAYLEAVEAPDDETRITALKNHAAQIRAHVQKLSSKAYWSRLPVAPDFVVMFLPGENFFSAALEQAPQLIEEGVQKRVILATPTSLIALLRAVAYGWQQEKLTENALKISTLGQELYDRISVMSNHFQTVGQRLDKAVEAYNKSIGSLEGRVLAAARRFTELGVESNKEVPQLEAIDRFTREIQAPELVNPLKIGPDKAD